MRCTTILLATLLSVTFSWANELVLIGEMKNMRDAMNKINDGFFYNRKEDIISGLDALQKANDIFKNHADIKNYLPKNKQHMTGISFNNARKMDANIKSMKQFINMNQYNQASTKYTEIINSCTACHSIVRGW